jgi:hypothetical protein
MECGDIRGSKNAIQTKDARKGGEDQGHRGKKRIGKR